MNRRVGPTCQGTVPHACQVLFASIVTNRQGAHNIKNIYITRRLEECNGSRKWREQNVYINSRHPLFRGVCNLESGRSLF